MSRLSAQEEEFAGPSPRDGYYDIFISFRGKETRYGFTDTLYHSLLGSKVYTFIDADLAGNVIETLFEIIGRSRMAVVVYSEEFASSHWCLTELELIMRRWEEKKMMMIPIFYKVQVHELKHPTEKTLKYFDEHIKNYDGDVVRKWKDAITKMGNVSGCPYKDVYGRSERDFINMQVIVTIKKKLREWRETNLESSSSKPYNNNNNSGSTSMENHDVFISFLGKDTRFDLVSNLCKALTNYRRKIKIFMVDRDLLKDESIFEVIQRSKMSVVVFSQNYTSSKWCLRELTKVLQCNKTTGQELLPIYYEITQPDLIKQVVKGKIADHLEKHARNEESETVQSWRNAIIDLSNMVGWRYSTTHNDSKSEALEELIQGIVEDISSILNSIEDDDKESTMNQQENVSLAQEEDTQALALQTDTSSPVRSGEADSADSDVDASVVVGNFSGEVDVAVENTEVEEGIEGGVTEQQADHDEAMIEKASASHQNIKIYPQLIQQEDTSCSTQSLFQHTNTATGDEEIYRVVTSAYFQKSDELKETLLNFTPDSLCFYAKRTEKPSPSCLIMSNNTDSYVAFTIKATDQPQNYSINPNKGLLLPHSKCQVIVTMESPSVLPKFRDRIDMLYVQSVEVKNDSYSMDDFFDLFTEKPGYYFSICDCRINVYCYAPLEEDSSVPDHIAQLANKGLVHLSKRVTSIDPHLTKPWLLLGFKGTVCIWNYETQAEEKSYNVENSFDIIAYFIHDKPWIVVFGGLSEFIRVFDYNTSEKVKEFKAHENYIDYMVVHPTLPYVLTASRREELIKLWNWKNDWTCSKTFKAGHPTYIMEIALNPRDATSFVSVHAFGLIKIWSFGSSTAKSKISTETELQHAEYFVGKLYLLISPRDCSVKVWDYKSKIVVQTLKGHSDMVTATLVHPKLPIIITGSTDKTIHIWNKNNYQLEHVWRCDLGKVWLIKLIDLSNEVVLGCDDGMVILRLSTQ